MTTTETDAMVVCWQATAAYQQTTADRDPVAYMAAWGRFYHAWQDRRSPERITRLAQLAGPYWSGPVWDLLSRQPSRLDTLADQRVVRRAIGDCRLSAAQQRDQEDAATVVRLQHLAAYQAPPCCIGTAADAAEAIRETTEEQAARLAG